MGAITDSTIGINLRKELYPKYSRPVDAVLRRTRPNATCIPTASDTLRKPSAAAFAKHGFRHTKNSGLGLDKPGSVRGFSLGIDWI